MNEKYIVRSTAVAARELGGEMIIMSAADSTLFSLNETATLIWQAADGKTPLSEIVEHHICPEFEVEPDEAYRDAARARRQISSVTASLHVSERAGSRTQFWRPRKSHELDGRSQSASAASWHSAERPSRRHLSLQRALRALLSRSRRRWRNDHRRNQAHPRSARRGGRFLPHHQRRRTADPPQTASKSSSTPANLASTSSSRPTPS